MSNLQLGDHLNNIIDDIERGDRQISVEQLDLAIARLMSIREKLEQSTLSFQECFINGC